MSIFQIPLQAIPNQSLSTTIGTDRWFITLELRLGKMYISLNKNDKDVLLNRVCQDKNPVGHGFVFNDSDGLTDPIYTGLNGRYSLYWTDEEIIRKSSGRADPSDNGNSKSKSYAPYDILITDDNLVSWSVRGDYDYMNYYRSTTPFDMSNLPSSIVSLNTTSYRDNGMTEGNSYYVMVSTVLNGVEKFSYQKFNYIAVLTLTATIYETEAEGKTASTAGLNLDVDTSLSANMFYNGNKIKGIAEPNAIIEIEVED